MKKIVLVFILKTSTDRCLNVKANLIVQYTWKYSINQKPIHRLERLPLHEKCTNTEFYLVRIFPHSDWLRRNTEYLSPNARKYGREKTPYLVLFTQCSFWSSTYKDFNWAPLKKYLKHHLVNEIKLMVWRFCAKDFAESLISVVASTVTFAI